MQRVYLEYMGDSVELPLGETMVGRDQVCNLRFNDPAVSRRHLRFIHRQDEVFVEDLGSSNGTLLNGRTVEAALNIVDGDTVSVGTRLITIRVVDGDDDEQPSTFVLAKLDFDKEKKAVRSVPAASAVTSQLTAVTVPPPMSSAERCPKCHKPVGEADEICVHCGHIWDEKTEIELDARPSPTNRRRHDRLPIELHLIYVSSELEVEVISRDLSESGVFVCSQVLDPVGTHCTLTILVDGGPPVDVRGIVRRVVEHSDLSGEPIGLGVEFVGVGADQLSWIRTMITRISTSEMTRPVDLL